MLVLATLVFAVIARRAEPNEDRRRLPLVMAGWSVMAVAMLGFAWFGTIRQTLLVGFAVLFAVSLVVARWPSQAMITRYGRTGARRRTILSGVGWLLFGVGMFLMSEILLVGSVMALTGLMIGLATIFWYETHRPVES